MTDMQAQMDRALKLVARLAKLGAYDEGVLARTREIGQRIKLPMTEVLDRVEGATIAQKCARIGVTRQSFYLWTRGMSRPGAKQAKRLAHLTGYDADEIQGRRAPLSFRARLAAARAAGAPGPARGI